MFEGPPPSTLTLHSNPLNTVKTESQRGDVAQPQLPVLP